jgi:hypothetical protein
MRTQLADPSYAAHARQAAAPSWFFEHSFGHRCTAKLGWNDHLSAILTKRKADGGLSDRDDIQTIAHYIDVDEGRLP